MARGKAGGRSRKASRKGSQKSSKRDDSRRREGPSAFWSGTLTFGLVSVPVELFPATRSIRPRMRMLTADGVPLRRRFFCPHDERFVNPESLVRGYEVEQGRHVVVLDEELEALDPRKSRDIDLRRFVPVSSVDPEYFHRGYFLAPGGDTAKPYRLLAEVMERTGRAGIATFVMRGKEYLVAIIAENGLLRAETLRFHDEIRSAEDVGLPEPRKAPREKVRAIELAIDELLEDEIDESMLVNRRMRGLEELIRKKERRSEDVVETPAVEDEVAEDAEDGEEGDLLEAIRRSLDSLQKDGAGENGRGHARQRSRNGADLAQLTKAELYERAAKEGIPGRSGMTKGELRKALRQHEE